jgi:hypothetical protein
MPNTIFRIGPRVHRLPFNAKLKKSIIKKLKKIELSIFFPQIVCFSIL